jgi:hypothetical protein
MKLFKVGKWIVWNGRVGVITHVDEDQVSSHFVDEQGLTIEEGRSDIRFIRLAEPHEIPAARSYIIPIPKKVTLWRWFSQTAAKILH